MSTRNRIPSPLEPYLRLPPEASLILLTGTLGCIPVWLTARFIASVLAPRQDVASSDEKGSATAVVLVSWMQDLAFWKKELRRMAGLDITKLVEQRRFSFLDCLSLHGISVSSALEQLEKTICDVIEQLKNSALGNVVLVLEYPDTLLATNSTTAHELSILLLRLRSRVRSTVLTCAADLPLLSATQGSPRNSHAFSPLETVTAAFLTQQASLARFVMSVRELDTGAAKDISGVLRVTRGGAAYDVDDEEQDSSSEVASEVDVREMEALYLVQRDGNVKVFERGTESGL
ncbi:hypothetical protein LTR37_009382 [Vermiconidia calcicola]|uniref:Uncharacterized protein n=1 Tax=Vermiconidia calcicola TaxID=1690605 RepID=A0ACC3N9M2_9PEZI|nr:hypothetical protein LTR37_009382 [Vermiconidia calcicola]